MSNNKVLAGVDMRDLDRLADGANLNLAGEVVAFVRRAGGRHGSVNIFDIMSELAELTGANESDIQDAFDIAYQDHRIQIDKNGFVKLINLGKHRSSALSNTKNAVNVSDDLLEWHTTKEIEGVAEKFTYKSVLHAMVDRFKIPAWVQDPKVWAKAIKDNDPQHKAFWGGVILSYRRYGGRAISIQSKTAEFQPRPFDVHPDVWTVSSDGFLMRDIKEIQSILADGIEPDDLKVELVESGFKSDVADKLIEDSLASQILI